MSSHFSICGFLTLAYPEAKTQESCCPLFSELPVVTASVMIDWILPGVSLLGVFILFSAAHEYEQEIGMPLFRVRGSPL